MRPFGSASTHNGYQTSSFICPPSASTKSSSARSSRPTLTRGVHTPGPRACEIARAMRRLVVAFLAALLLSRCAAAKFDMQGKCAALFHSQKWLDEDELHNWDYKVRVEPWTVFAHVTVKLHGINMQLQNVYGGTVSKLGGSTFTVELNAVGGAGCEDCFEISGTGQPSADPEISCSGLLSAAERSSCDLGVTFHVVSLMRPGEDGGGESGAFNAAAHVTTWVEPTDVTLNFDRPITIRDEWNSFIVDGGVQSKSTTFRIKKQVCSHSPEPANPAPPLAPSGSSHDYRHRRTCRWARGTASASKRLASLPTAPLGGCRT